MRLNFLEVCLSPDLGGLELCVVDYLKFFKLKTSCNIVIAPSTKLDKFVKDDDKFLLKANRLFPFLPAFKLAKYIDKNSIDIVHFHWSKDIATVVLAKLLSKKKPKLVHSRHMSMTRFKSDFYHKWLYQNIDIMHAITLQVKEQLERFIPEDIIPKIEMLYLGVSEPIVNHRRVLKLKNSYKLDDFFVVGMVGRIEELKGQYILLEALKKLNFLKIKVLIVGHAMDDEYLLKLKSKVLEYALEDRVIFTGFTKEINEHIKLCDVTVLATKKETFGLVIIESMINRVPVIATNKGGPLEIIEDMKDGLFFDRSAEDLARKIGIFYENSELKIRLSKNGYDKVKKTFNKEVQMQKMYEVLSES